jgi:hypothetical protein
MCRKKCFAFLGEEIPINAVCLYEFKKIRPLFTAAQLVTLMDCTYSAFIVPVRRALMPRP